MANIRLLTSVESHYLSRAIHLLSTTQIDGFYGLPFLAPAFGHARVFVDEDCPTAYTDGNYRIGISPDFLDEKQTPLAQLAFIVAHEVLHSFLRHSVRQKRIAQTQDVANVAGDLEINSQLIEGCLGASCHGPITTGPNAKNGRWEYVAGGVVEDYTGKYVLCLVPGKGDYNDCPAGLTMEAYAKLITENSSQEASDKNSKGNAQKNVDDSEGNTSSQQSQRPLEPNDLKDETDVVFAQAKDELGIDAVSAAQREVVENACQAAAKEFIRNAYGSESMLKLLQFVFDRIRPSERDWQELFAKHVTNTLGNVTAGRADYSFARPSRRRHAGNIIFPSFMAHEPKIACVIDTSGSMQKRDFEKAASEILVILDNTADIQIAYCDAKSSEIYTANDIDAVLDSLRGGGGTHLVPALDKLNSDGEPFDLGVILTDGYFNAHTMAQRIAKDAHPWIIALTSKDALPANNLERELNVAGASDTEVVICANT